MIIKAKSDFYVGLTLLIISITIFILTMDIIEGAATFPRGLSILLSIFSITILLSSFKKGKVNKTETADDSGVETNITFNIFINAVISAAIIALYIILVNYIGYIFSTLLYMIVYFYYMKIKGGFKYIFIPVGFVLFVYFLFVVGLNVRLP